MKLFINCLITHERKKLKEKLKYYGMFTKVPMFEEENGIDDIVVLESSEIYKLFLYYNIANFGRRKN